MSNEPDRLYIDEKDREKYDQLLSKGNPFSREQGFDNKDLFLLAMCTGCNEGNKTQLKTRFGYFLSKNLSNEDEAIVFSIAVLEEGLDVLRDKRKIYLIAEQYAAGGIHILYNNVFGGQLGSFIKRFENQLQTKFREQKNKSLKPAESTKVQPPFDLIEQGENEKVEFKSSMIWDYMENKENKRLMGSVIAKTVSSFMNSDGGTLIVGVDDSKTVLGLAHDFSSLRKATKDEYKLHFTNIINKHLGKENRTYVHEAFELLNGLDLLIIQVEKRAPRPVFFKSKGKDDEFIVRMGNSSQSLDVREANVYIKDNW